MSAVLPLQEILEDRVSLAPTGVVGLYALFQGDVLVYIGQSLNVHKRVLTHMLEGKKDFDSYRVIPTLASELSESEVAYIVEFKPLYNANIPPNNRYKSINFVKKNYEIHGLKLKKLIRQHNLTLLNFGLTTYLDIVEFEGVFYE